MTLKKLAITLAVLLSALFAFSPIASAKLATKAETPDNPPATKAIIVDRTQHSQIRGRIVTNRTELAEIDQILAGVVKFPAEKIDLTGGYEVGIATNGGAKDTFYEFRGYYTHQIVKQKSNAVPTSYLADGAPLADILRVVENPLDPRPRSDVQAFAIIETYRPVFKSVAANHVAGILRRFCEKPGNAEKLLDLVRELMRQPRSGVDKGIYGSPVGPERDTIELYFDCPDGFIAFGINRREISQATDLAGATKYYGDAHPNTSDTFDEILRLITEPAEAEITST